MLAGCAEHRCFLRNTCGWCGNTIPLSLAPLRIGICPHCQGDLRLGQSEPLIAEAEQITEQHIQELEFFLEPQPWEESSSEVIKRVGGYLSHLRRMKRLNAMAVAQHLGLTLSRIEGLERGNPMRRGVKFGDYLAYADFLEVPLQELFITAGQECIKHEG